MNTFSSKNIFWPLAFLLIGLTYIFGLFIDLTGDSGLYAAITRQMTVSGDWLNLRLHGQPYDQKPHLLFWLAGLGVKLFGNSNFAFKLFPAIYGWLGFYFIYRLASYLFSNEVGKWASLAAASSQIFILYFLDIHTDTILQTGVVLALWQLSGYLNERKILNFVLGFIGIGLAMFSKGPIGAVLPFFAVLIYIILNKKFTELFHPKWILGILISLLIASPTLFHLYKSFGLEGIKFYFITNNFGRISGEYAGSSSDPFFYLYNFIWAFLPFTFLGIISIIQEIKSWKRKSGYWEKSLLGSVFILLLILSIAKGKGPNYFLLTFPVFSIFTAKWLVELNHKKSKSNKFTIRGQRIILYISAIQAVFVFFLFHNSGWIVPVVLSGLVLVILFFAFQKSASLKQTVLFSVIVTSALNLYLNLSVIPELFSFQGARQALNIYEKERNPKDILVNLHLDEYELFYHANSKVQEFTNWREFYKLFEKEGTWIYTNKVGYNGILDLNHKLDTVYRIPQHGMNRLTLPFLNPKTRQNELTDNYLIKVH